MPIDRDKTKAAAMTSVGVRAKNTFEKRKPPVDGGKLLLQQ
jgi:hypothetical protein